MPARRVLAVLATAAECDAVLPAGEPARVALGPYRGTRIAGTTYLVSGIGPAAAAAATATALSLGAYDLVVSLGICGGFAGAAEIGDVVLATDVVAADLGAQSPDGFLGLAELGWSEEARPAPASLLLRGDEALRAAGLRVVTGPVLTVSTATGTDDRAALLATRHGAVAEAMEGAGVAEAAAAHSVAMMEVRAVSNLVGRRDLSAWRIPAALATLRGAVAVLLGDGGAWC